MHNIGIPKNLTVSFDYAFPPKLEISACFTAGIYNFELDECLTEAGCYHTEYSVVYLFPVFKELAEQYNIEFSVQYNTIWGIRRYIYAALIAFGNYVVKKEGLDKYKKSMKVTYDRLEDS